MRDIGQQRALLIERESFVENSFAEYITSEWLFGEDRCSSGYDLIDTHLKDDVAKIVRDPAEGQITVRPLAHRLGILR